MNKSIVYKNIYLYRFILNVLYSGGYKHRFSEITKLLGKSSNVIELCFGDIYIAKYCKENNINWVGYDLNKSFVDHALKLGFNAQKEDVMNLQSIPQCEVLIMQGSLYHFHDKIDSLFNLVSSCTNRFIISEPIKNLSSQSGLLGRIARVSANAGNGDEKFRFTEPSFINMLEKYKLIFSFSYQVVYKKRDIVVEINFTK